MGLTTGPGGQSTEPTRTSNQYGFPNSRTPRGTARSKDRHGSILLFTVLEKQTGEAWPCPFMPRPWITELHSCREAEPRSPSWRSSGTQIEGGGCGGGRLQGHKAPPARKKKKGVGRDSYQKNGGNRPFLWMRLDEC